MALTKISRGLLSTGVSDSSDATAVTITSDEDFLVRQTSADVYDTNTGGTVRQYWGNQFSAQNNQNSRIIIGSANNAGLIGGATVNSGGTKPIVNSYISFGSTSQTAGSEAGMVQFYTSTGGATGAVRARIDSDGLKFGSDTAAANALDDYEEGSWTPVAAGVTTAVSYSGYVKIGRLVYCHAYINFVPPNNSTQFQITGLPYPSSAGYFGGTIGYVQNKNFNDFFGPIAALNQSYIYFHKNDGVDASVVNSTVYDLGGGSRQYIIFTFTYMTA
jgi:hypothetical protein